MENRFLQNSFLIQKYSLHKLQASHLPFVQRVFLFTDLHYTLARPNAPVWSEQISRRLFRTVYPSAHLLFL